MAKRRFRIVLIKPSHYDDDGYVIQWRRSTIPSNSLASVYGLLAECAEARVLGPDVDIAFEIYDECNTIVDIPAISRRILGDGGMVAMVGVQSNQFPRALDIGRQFRASGVTVAVGGFHVSGCIAMLPELPPDLKAAQALGIILYAGEGEGRLAGVPEGRRFGHAEARLQLSQRHARHGGRRHPRSAARGRDQGRRPLYELRRRARLPVPVLVLHHHQCAGPQVALSHARRRGGDRARQFRAGGHALLRHRRQFRPQPQLGADPRPPDRTAGEPGFSDQAPAAGRHALPQDPELHRKGRAGRLQCGVHRAREHQPRNRSWARRSARTRSGNIATCCRRGGAPR